MQPQQPSQTPSHHSHRHHHHHHHHCSSPMNHYPHRRHNSSPHCVHSSLLRPSLLHHIHHHGHHHGHQFNPMSSHLHFRSIAPYMFSSSTPNPCPFPASFSDGCGYSGVSTAAEVFDSVCGFQDLKPDALEHGEEDLEDVFVLTDEWREFFAKSEAKRRMEKEQKNKHRR
ncbi:hypothetical protein KSP39_PZI003860 [Platanthera zijinensis]|uniref:Uncharacterized protein n=1 Tax=Platanthera zijinensis TaxID=2320716 RepID=A0AAP0BVW0_9ASPA